MKGLGLPLRFFNRCARAVKADHSSMRIAAAIKGRENTGTATEIKNGGGIGKPSADQWSDGQIIVIALAIKNRQNPRYGGQIIERDFILDGSLPFSFDMLMQRGDIVG